MGFRALDKVGIYMFQPRMDQVYCRTCRYEVYSNLVHGCGLRFSLALIYIKCECLVCFLFWLSIIVLGIVVDLDCFALCAGL